MGGTEAAPNRAWRNKVKRQIRDQIKANEGAKGDSLTPSARTLFDRRHAVVATDPLDATRLIFLRACTCTIGEPHLDTTATTEGITR